MFFTGVYEDSQGHTGVLVFGDLAASSAQEAMDTFNRETSNYQLISCKSQHGGYRPGAGRPGRFSEKCINKKVPETLAAEFDSFLLSVSALIEISQQYEEMSDAASQTSPRYERLRKYLSDSAELRANLKKVLDAIY